MLLAGTTIRRASLHNVNEIERLGLHKNDTVIIEKGGEIIPKIISINTSKRDQENHKVEFITNCPICETTLIRKEGEANHYCPNENGCKPQILGKMDHFIQRKALDIDGLGPETIELLYSHGLIQDVGDLYSLGYDDVIQLERMAEKSVHNLLDGIEKSKTIGFDKVLFGLGIRFVGATVAEKLAEHYLTVEKLSTATNEDLIDVPEIGGRIAESVISYFQEEKNQSIITKLKNAGVQLEIKKSENSSIKLDGNTFVVSGVFETLSRDELKKLIKENGGKVVSSISGKLNYLVAGENMGPSKLEKANKLNITIISEQEFLKLLK